MKKSLTQRTDRSQIQDSDLSVLKKLVDSGRVQDVTTIDLSDSAVTDDGLQNLRYLSGVKYLFLNRTHISDQGLDHLTMLNDLRWIELNDTKITDAGLQRLGYLNNLSVLYVQGTSVTWDGIFRLQESFWPDTAVEVVA